MEKFLIIDGNSIANRAFYALPFLSNHKGEPSGAVYGFANILIKMINDHKPTYIAVAFDHARKTFRNEIYAEYKMQRKQTPQELIDQFPIIKEMLKCMKITVLEQEGIEADDIIGTLTKTENVEKIVLSGDKDLLQLIDDNTTVWLTKKGVSELDKVDENRLNEIFGIKPFQIIELKALMGDASDNIPGVKGIGEKTALNLLTEYTDVENVYKNIDKISGKLNEKLVSDKEMAFVSKKLATIKRDCSLKYKLEDCKLEFPFKEDVFEFFKNYDFTSLVKNEKLFDLEKKPEKNDTKERIEITNKNIEEIVNFNGKDFCYDLENLEFLVGNKIYFLSKNFDMFDSNLSIDELVKYLKNVFENENILKITKFSKKDMHFLAKYNIKLNNYFDLLVAEYVVNAGLKDKSFEQIAVEDFEKTMEELDKKIKEKNLDFVFDKIEKPLTEILFNMEENGFKINQEKLESIDQEFIEKIGKLTKEIYLQAGEEFNINSPKQVANILFDKLQIKSYNNKKQSTSATKLDELRFIPIVDNILTYRKYNKIKTTYVDVYKKLIQENGDIIHTTFNQTLTSTGRLSSSEPNLQNIPTRDDVGKGLRKIFESKFNGGEIISADYNQIELRLLADMSGEKKLIDAYKNGEDIHTMTASQIFGVETDEVSDIQRREAKSVNFGIIYGISDFGLSQNIKTTRAKAKDYINSYFNRYPTVKEFMDKNVESAKEKGYAVTKFGRIRIIPEINSSKYVTRQFGERVAMNMPLQGTASDIIKIAMIRVYNAIKKLNLKSQLILQIHDELIIDVYPGENKKIIEILKNEMENATKLAVPLIISVGEGKNLYECK